MNDTSDKYTEIIASPQEYHDNSTSDKKHEDNSKSTCIL